MPGWVGKWYRMEIIYIYTVSYIYAKFVYKTDSILQMMEIEPNWAKSTFVVEFLQWMLIRSTRNSATHKLDITYYNEKWLKCGWNVKPFLMILFIICICEEVEAWTEENSKMFGTSRSLICVFFFFIFEREMWEWNVYY